MLTALSCPTPPQFRFLPSGIQKECNHHSRQLWAHIQAYIRVWKYIPANIQVWEHIRAEIHVWEHSKTAHLSLVAHMSAPKSLQAHTSAHTSACMCFFLAPGSYTIKSRTRVSLAKIKVLLCLDLRSYMVLCVPNWSYSSLLTSKVRAAEGVTPTLYRLPGVCG